MVLINVHVLYQLQWYGRVAGINLSQILHACNSANPNWLSARSGLEDINQSKDIWISALKNDRCQSGC